MDREASEKEREKSLPTLKDNDFVKDNIKLYVRTEDRLRLMEMLEKDCAFLSRMNLMDYSLCLGIHDVERYELEAMECIGNVAAVGSYSEEEEFGSLPPAIAPLPPGSPGRHSNSNSTGQDVGAVCGNSSGDNETGKLSSSSSNQNLSHKRDPGAVPTPPDSPHLHHKSSNASEHELLIENNRALVDPNRDIYAIPSSSGKFEGTTKSINQ